MKNYPYQSCSKPSTGFTLPELLVGVLITTIALTLAGAGFVTLAQKSAKSDSEIDRRIDLNRAVEFMADEIREASSVSTSIPSGWSVPAGYTGILYLTRPSAPTTIVYYTGNAASTGWRNQLVIYRATASNDLGQPLVDGLANANPGCPGGSTTDGFQVSPATLTTITRQVTLCLLGYVPGQSNLQVKGQSGPRACEGTECSVGSLPNPS
ncbi:MAG: prepilin-type N-terminal cleavage/methylation domain-containing protein [Acaryochloris sp. RU_4_1]|nr:prepilin-type N-terminal cleavage/methylation domain-containing protein [Acaryochloris sp. RU_4_1]NJR57287.1 prepilin-type N-terminal cleavage/methylation domain-containing protein [Acaryochloris sp. CRU_2_0]